MGIKDPFRKWRRNSYVSPPSSTIQQTGKLDLYHNDTSCRQVLTTPPPSSSSKKKAQKQYPPSPDLYLSGIGDYTFVRQIGQGKFSKVLLSYHYLTKKQVAIKIIDKRIHDYGVMSRLSREIALMELLDHPNIVQLYETYETTDSLFIVMEYIEGCNLEEYLQKTKGKLSEIEARAIFRQMVSALDYCHSKWVVHRDIKAPNILLTKDNQVKIADFGLGNKYGRRRLKTICGSKLYYSPEIVNGQGYTGPEIDCWCLGVLLFRMTVGEEPFSKAKTMGELKRDVSTGNFIIPHTLNPDLKNTILKCMSMDKTKRSRLYVALKDDPWLSDHDKLPFILQHGPTTPELMKMQYQLDSLELEKSAKTEKKRTIVCHPKTPSIYFTSTVPHSSKPQDIFKNSEAQRLLHLQAINTISLQIQLSKGSKSPIRQLLRKIKPTEQHAVIPRAIRKTSSNMSLSQIYHRVAKDQVYHYSFTPPQDGTNVMMVLIETICSSMGITYHLETPDRLICVMNESIQTYQLRRKDSKLDQSSQASFSSVMSGKSSQMIGTSRIGKLKRTIMSSLFQSSLKSTREIRDVENTEESFTMFSIDLHMSPKDGQQTSVTVKLSKLGGSTRVFRVVCGWMSEAIKRDDERKRLLKTRSNMEFTRYNT